MVTPAKRASNDKWDRENMTILACKVRKDYAEQVKASAAARGTTVNSLLLSAIADFMRTPHGNTVRIILDDKEDGFTMDQLEDAARRSGQSVNAWIIDAIKDKI